MPLTSSLSKRYPHESEMGKTIRESLLEVCKRYISAGLGDANAEQNLLSDNTYKYWQQLSEVLLADQLAKAGLDPIHKSEGPDFLIERDGKKIWIEVITPEPNGIPNEWINHVSGTVTFPHEAILLRWTAAIKEKAEKLQSYLKSGLVKPEDAYVIAVNSRLLRGFGGVFPELHGISQFPFAVEATFRVGPYGIKIDPSTLKTVGSGHQDRLFIPKSNGAQVPANTFLDPNFSSISAIWAVDVDELLLLEQTRPMVIVHNPLATNPIPKNFLPAQSEYVTTEHSDHYQLDRCDVRTSSDC
jgi:hypothetical protein